MSSVPKRNIRCDLAYSGKNFFGFQKTKIGPSIEGELTSALEQILQHPVLIQGASRTDRGVHAEGQVVNFFTSKPIELTKLCNGLRSLLPKTISVLKLQSVDPTFHPTLDSQGKEYHYWVCTAEVQLPCHLDFSWHYPLPLNIDLMQHVAKQLVGKHNFSAFSSLQYVDPIRTIEQINIEMGDGRLCFSIRGDRFLYKMVRTIVGTLLYVGSGKLPMEIIEILLKPGKRANAGVTAPAHGLTLKQVFYPQQRERSIKMAPFYPKEGL